ncbi:hypothetical protein [Clostridium sp. C2-6-12]|uniref:hypothetical protein n=1 Tax=Clostridium sp. C2-6-12 TaxID=2698832 RepID=UPI00136E8BBF|nr:hypothetical protein [Clostridium sp. C2-6-12]
MSDKMNNDKIETTEGKYNWKIIGCKVLSALCSAIDKILGLIFTCIALMISNSTWDISVLECVGISIVCYILNLWIIELKDKQKMRYTELETNELKLKIKDTKTILTIKIEPKEIDLDNSTSTDGESNKKFIWRYRIAKVIIFITKYINSFGYIAMISPVVKSLFNEIVDNNYIFTDSIKLEIGVISAISIFAISLSEYANIYFEKVKDDFIKTPESDITADIPKEYIEGLRKQISKYKKDNKEKKNN